MTDLFPSAVPILAEESLNGVPLAERLRPRE